MEIKETIADNIKENPIQLLHTQKYFPKHLYKNKKPQEKVIMKANKMATLEVETFAPDIGLK